MILIQEVPKTQLLIVSIVKFDCILFVDCNFVELNCNSIEIDISTSKSIEIEIDCKSTTIFTVEIIVSITTFVVLNDAVIKTSEIDCKSIDFSTSRSRSIDF